MLSRFMNLILVHNNNWFTCFSAKKNTAVFRQSRCAECICMWRFRVRLWERGASVGADFDLFNFKDLSHALDHM